MRTVGDRQRRQSALHGDDKRLTAPENIDAADVCRVAHGGRVSDLGQAEGGGTREDGLDVAAHDVGDLPEGVGDVLVVEQLGSGVAEQGPGQVGGGLPAGVRTTLPVHGPSTSTQLDTTSSGSSPASGTSGSSSPTRATHAS